jgi:dienelactone hydrolase
MLISEDARNVFRSPKDDIMQTPQRLKSGLHGAACGAIALAVVGFSWGGWVTVGMARTMAADQSKRDPQFAERVAAIKATSSWNRGDLVTRNGWATMPGTAEGNRQVTTDCADKIAA